MDRLKVAQELVKMAKSLTGSTLSLVVLFEDFRSAFRFYILWISLDEEVPFSQLDRMKKSTDKSVMSIYNDSLIGSLDKKIEDTHVTVYGDRVAVESSILIKTPQPEDRSAISSLANKWNARKA